jgi:hypothetical protein
LELLFNCRAAASTVDAGSLDGYDDVGGDEAAEGILRDGPEKVIGRTQVRKISKVEILGESHLDTE